MVHVMQYNTCTVAIFMYHIAGHLVGKKFGEFESNLFEHWQKKFGELIDQPKDC